MADRQNYPGLNQGPYGEGSQGYPPQGYPPQGGYPTQGYPPQNYPPQSGYPSQSGYGHETSGGYPPQTNFASSGYPPSAGYGSTTTSSSVHGGGYPQQGGYGEAAGYSYPQAHPAPAQSTSGHGYAPPQQQQSQQASYGHSQGIPTNHQGTKVEDPAKKKNDKFGELGGLASGAYAMYKKHGKKPDSSHSSATATSPQTSVPNQANASGTPPKKTGGDLSGLASGAYALYKQYNVKVETGQESKHRMETLQGAAHLASDGFSYFEHHGKKELPEGAFDVGEPGTKRSF